MMKRPGIHTPLHAFGLRARRWVPMVGAVLNVAAGGLAADADSVLLVEGGRARATIIVADDAPRNTQLAVEELRHYLERISGAYLEIVDDPSAAGDMTRIWVGAHPRLEAEVAGGSVTFEQPEEILIAAVGARDLVIAGEDELGSGTALAVYTFLQDHLGVRWFWPGELGEDVIEQATLAFKPFSVRYHPQVRQRNYRHDPVGRDTSQRAEDLRRWMRLHRMGHGHRSFSMSAGHAFTDWWERFGAEHPEYFALQPDGTRGPAGSPHEVKLCVSNPAVHERWMLENESRFEHSRGSMRMASASPNDNPHVGVCVCANCRDWDHRDGARTVLRWADGVSEEHVALTNRKVRFWNALARKLKDRFPGEAFYVGAWAYQIYAVPPINLALEDNIVIGFVESDFRGTWGGFFAYPQDLREQDREVWRTWADKAAFMVWRPNLGFTRAAALGFPQLAMQRSAEDFRFMADHNLIGLDIDNLREHWSTQGLQHYLIAQLAWNPYADTEAILADYFRRAFGPAAAEVEAYNRYLEALYYQFLEDTGGLSRVAQLQVFVDHYTPEALSRAGELLAAAEARVTDAPEVHRQRVAFLRQGFDYVEAQMQSYRVMEILRSGPRNMIAAIHQANAAAARVDALVAEGARTYALSTRRSRGGSRDYFGPPGEEYQDLLQIEDLIDDFAHPWVNTPRRWQFQLDPDNVGIRENWQNGLPDPVRKRVHDLYSWDRPLRSETDRELAARMRGYAGAGWYHTSFGIPDETWQGREIYIFFPAVSDSCRVYVNGELAGERIAEGPDDWEQPFLIRVDAQVDFDAPRQQLVVHVVRDPRSNGPGGINRQPRVLSREPAR